MFNIPQVLFMSHFRSTIFAYGLALILSYTLTHSLSLYVIAIYLSLVDSIFASLNATNRLHAISY